MLKYFSVLLGKIANGYVEVVGDYLLEEVKAPFENYGQLADGPTRRRQLADVKNRVETSASWSSIQYNLLEVKHTEK